VYGKYVEPEGRILMKGNERETMLGSIPGKMYLAVTRFSCGDYETAHSPTAEAAKVKLREHLWAATAAIPELEPLKAHIEVFEYVLAE
jgi:hypothetical protein